MLIRFALRPLILGAAMTALLAADMAQAQWVMVARHVLGRVEQMSQQAPQVGGASYDSAAVMIEVPADKVYAAVLRGVQNNPQGVKITREDATERVVQFTNGAQVAGIKLSAVGDNVTHLLISSAHTGNQPDAAALVLNNVLRVCKDMNVQCSQARH
ncbi:MAG: hypothetical protein ABI777_10440 [Betaproteobacteria bacterium]